MEPKAKSGPIIEANRLGFQYEGSLSKAIDQIEITINHGDFVLLTGPSGCGKTTLCRCLNGLIPHFYPGKLEGSLLVDGEDCTRMPTSELSRKIGYVFQNPENQLFALTIEKDVAFGPENLALPKEEIRERVEWAMKVTGTTDLRHLAPYELSGGEQQRVALAGVLAMRPAVVVMDEPTSFLDPRTAEEVMNSVSMLRSQQGITVIVVEHRLDLVTRFADRIIVMDAGRVVADGNVQDVLDSQFDQLVGLGIGVPKVGQLWNMLRKDLLVSGHTPKTVESTAEKLGEKLAS